MHFEPSDYFVRSVKAAHLGLGSPDKALILSIFVCPPCSNGQKLSEGRKPGMILWENGRRLYVVRRNVRIMGKALKIVGREKGGPAGIAICCGGIGSRTAVVAEHPLPSLCKLQHAVFMHLACV